MKRLTGLLLFLTSFFAANQANAQLGVYANFGAAKINSSTDWIYGPSFGAYLDHGHFLFLSTGVDARGVILGTGSDTKFDAGYIGPRIAVRPHILPIKPYIEGLVGVGYTQIGQGASQESATKFSYQAVGGLDFTLLPRIDWRVAEFSYGGLSILNGSVHPKTISTGIVIRLPGVF
jgi:hypothetical protein